MFLAIEVTNHLCVFVELFEFDFMGESDGRWWWWTRTTLNFNEKVLVFISIQLSFCVFFETRTFWLMFFT